MGKIDKIFVFVELGFCYFYKEEVMVCGWRVRIRNEKVNVGNWRSLMRFVVR